MNFKADGPTYNGMLDCARHIAQTEGYTGLYKGFGAQWLRMVPHTMIQFIVWEKLRQMFKVRPI